MKPSHIQTPRSLADCQFDVGYPSASSARETILERIAGYGLAVLIGVSLAMVLVAWWSS